MTPSWGDSGFSLEPGSKEDRKPTLLRIVGLGAILVLCFVVAKGCQNDQVRFTQEEAVAVANESVDFKPTFTQVRLLRQGINRQAFWFVSLSIPIGYSGDRPDLFAALSVVQIDAKSGEVVGIKQQSAKDTERAKAEAARRDEDGAVQERLQESGDP